MKGRDMTKTTTARGVLAATAIAALFGATSWSAALAQGDAPPAQGDITGAYQCRPNPNPCLWPGSGPSILKSGSKVEIKNEKGEVADGTMTSDITLAAGAPFNSLGIVRPDHSIDWSNGTTWRKK
jgi:hypothetical protein